MSDVIRTISAPAQDRFTVKMSRFLSFIYPVRQAEEARAIVKEITAKYHDSRHVCWAYMLGAGREEWQLTDNGEPSGTAGRPILGQINSAVLTDVLIIVVRYFGGIKLGTPGLIAAYREAARLAIEAAEVVERFDMARLEVRFPYTAMEGVMRLVKGLDLEVVEREFDNSCRLAVEVRRSEAESCKERFAAIDGVKCELTD